MIVIGIIERKEREKEEMREDILKAARKLINSEGVEGVTVRKIAGIIEYSPAIIYHYFKNKEEIVERLIAEDYGKIIKSLSDLQTSGKTPEEKLRASAVSYISLAVEIGDSYKSIMLNNSPTVLAYTSVLHKGAAAEQSSIAMLCRVLREFPALTDHDDLEIEATAQIIWSTAFGLSLRLIVESVDEEQRWRLIDQAVKLILRSCG